MRAFFIRWRFNHRSLAACLAVALLALAFTCAGLLPILCAGSHQTCQHDACWLLHIGAIAIVMVAFIWRLWGANLALPREYPLLLFKPPWPTLLRAL